MLLILKRVLISAKRHMNNMTNKIKIRSSHIQSQLKRFLINGGIATIFDYLVFSLVLICLVELADNELGFLSFIIFFVEFNNIEHAFAKSIGYLVGLTISYTGNRLFVFQNSLGERKTAIRYFFLYGIGLLLNFLLMHFLADHLGYNKTFSFVAIVGSIAIINFFVNRYWVFGYKKTV